MQQRDVRDVEEERHATDSDDDACEGAPGLLEQAEHDQAGADRHGEEEQ
jgi:hypothetical protein